MKYRKSYFLLSVILMILVSCNAHSQEPVTEAQIDELFEAWNNEKSPGMGIGIVSKGELIFAKGYGMANLEHGIPITPRSVFDIASVSKQFAGMAIGMLIQEGKIKEGDDMRKYLPDFPNYGHTITVGNLLHHTSGIRDWPSLLIAAGYQMEDVISFKHILSLIYAQKELNFIPGDEYVYSNSNYNLLVQILETVTDDKFDRWTKNNIFKPLGMNDTHFHIDHRRLVENKVDSYAPLGPKIHMNIANNLCAVGSSSLFTTIEDLSKWLINFGSEKLGGRELFRMMTKKGQLNNGDNNAYGFGIIVTEIKGNELWAHSGGWAGFRTFMAYYPKQEFGIIFLSNLATVQPNVEAMKLLELYFPKLKRKDPKQQKAKQEKKVSEKAKAESDFDSAKVQLDQYSGRFASDELSTEYVLKILNGKLIIDNERSGQLTLKPLKKDLFQAVGVGAEIRFERTENGEIMGFRLSMMPRTRNILFTKM